MYLLDTNICIYIIRKKPKKVLNQLQSISPTEIGISAVTLGELQYGVENSKQPTKNQEALNYFLAPLEIYLFGVEAAQMYGKVRADLETRGKTIGPFDTMIGAHALALGAILVTNNTREFSRIKSLSVENWTR